MATNTAGAFAKQRIKYPAVDAVPGTMRLEGMFTTNNTSDPTTKSTGPFSVSRSGVGTLVVTLTENAVEILSYWAHTQDSTGSSKRAYVISSSVGTASTGASITIETQSTAGTKADLNGPIVSFGVVYRKAASTK